MACVIYNKESKQPKCHYRKCVSSFAPTRLNCLIYCMMIRQFDIPRFRTIVPYFASFSDGDKFYWMNLTESGLQCFFLHDLYVLFTAVPHCRIDISYSTSKVRKQKGHTIVECCSVKHTLTGPLPKSTQISLPSPLLKQRDTCSSSIDRYIIHMQQS